MLAGGKLWPAGPSSVPAAELLASQWPVTGPRCRVQPMACGAALRHKRPHLLLINPSREVMAHCPETVGKHRGVSAALASGVIVPSRRGGGVVRALLWLRAAPATRIYGRQMRRASTRRAGTEWGWQRRGRGRCLPLHRLRH